MPADGIAKSIAIVKAGIRARILIFLFARDDRYGARRGKGIRNGNPLPYLRRSLIPQKHSLLARRIHLIPVSADRERSEGSRYDGQAGRGVYLQGVKPPGEGKYPWGTERIGTVEAGESPPGGRCEKQGCHQKLQYHGLAPPGRLRAGPPVGRGNLNATLIGLRCHGKLSLSRAVFRTPRRSRDLIN
jgi:hypothetical protein